MDLIREEMTLLAEVDQPGSLIDSYVDKLDALLARKTDGAPSLLFGDVFRTCLSERTMQRMVCACRADKSPQ